MTSPAEILECGGLVANLDRLRDIAERYSCDDINGDLDFEKWGQAMPPLDVLALCRSLDGREHAMHMRIRADYDRTVADAWRSKVEHLRTLLANPLLDHALGHLASDVPPFDRDTEESAELHKLRDAIRQEAES